MPFLRKHIPGNPSVVIEFMEGGGGAQSGHHLFQNRKPDGLTIGALSSSVIGLQVMKETGVMYDIDKFIYLGTPVSENHNVIYTRRELGLNSLDKFASGPPPSPRRPRGRRGGVHLGALVCVFLDLKAPKFVTGYNSLEADVALRNARSIRAPTSHSS